MIIFSRCLCSIGISNYMSKFFWSFPIMFVRQFHSLNENKSLCKGVFKTNYMQNICCCICNCTYDVFLRYENFQNSLEISLYETLLSTIFNYGKIYLRNVNFFIHHVSQNIFWKVLNIGLNLYEIIPMWLRG